MAEVASGSTSGNWGWGALLEAATPELYRHNAFRVTGLTVDVDMREVKRQAERLSMMKRLGLASDQSRGGYLPLRPPPDEETIKAARERLYDSQRRLVDELFWFWPARLGAGEDEGLLPLKENRIDDAIKCWARLEGDGGEGWVATHNLAVLYHLAALDLEHLAETRTLSDATVTWCELCWQEAYRRWRRLLDEERFWSRLTDIIRQADDPRLTTGMARRIRGSLPRLLLMISARLAVRAAEKQNEREAHRHVQLMHESGFDAALVESTLQEALRPVRERVKMLCAAVPAEVGESSDTADHVAERLLETGLPLLSTLHMVLPRGHPYVDAAYDEVAKAALQTIIAYGNKAENWARCVTLLQPVSGLATSISLRARIEENLERVEGYARQETQYAELRQAVTSNKVYDVTIHAPRIQVPKVCTCCLGPAELEQEVSSSWEETKGLKRYRRTRSFKFPLCKDCQRHQDQLRWRRVSLVFLALGLSVAASYVIGLNIERVGYVAFVAIGLAISAAALAVLSSLIGVRVLDSKHASRGSSVSMEHAHELGFTFFRFWNPVYALRFAEGNNTEPTPKRFSKYSNGRHLLRGRSASQIIASTVVLALIGHSIVYAVLDDGWRAGRTVTSRGSQSTQTRSASPRSRTTPPRTGGPESPGESRTWSVAPPVPSPATPAPDYGRLALKSQIDQGKAGLRLMESELGRINGQLESLSLRLRSCKRTIDSYESRAALGLPVDRTSYQTAIDSHNVLADQYNRVLGEGRAKQAEYEAEIERVNGIVRRFNSGLRR